MTTISFRSLKQDQGRRFTINIFLCHRIAIVIFIEKEKKINLKLKHNRYKANVYAAAFSSPGGKICFYNIKRRGGDDHLGDLEDVLACCRSPSCPDVGRPASAAAVSTPRCCADLRESPSAAPSNWQRVRPPPPAPQ